MNANQRITKAKISELLVIMGDHYQQPIESPGVVAQTWLMSLGDAPAALIEAACQMHMRDSKWFPKSAEIREIAFDLVSTLPAPDDAWGITIAEAQRISTYGKPQLPAEVMQAIRTIGGWEAVCFSQINDHRLRESFLRAYGRILDRTKRYGDLQKLALSNPDWKRNLPALGSGS